MRIWTETAYQKIMTDALPGDDSVCAISMSMARNEAESAQILLRSDAPFRICSVSCTGFETMASQCHFQETIAFQDGVAWPDPLSNLAVREVAAKTTQGIWLTIRTQKDQTAGSFQGIVKIEVDQHDGSTEWFEVPVAVRVYAVTLPDSCDATLSVEYWINTIGYWWRRPTEEKRDFILRQYGFEPWTTGWWKVVGSIADSMVDNRINVLFVRTQDLLLAGGSTRDDQGTYHFIWSKFDAYIQFFLDRRAVKRLAGFHIIRQTEGEYVYLIGPDESRQMVIQDARLDSREGQQWLSQFLPALYSHLQEKDWLALWLQHVEDEPADARSWQIGRQAIRDWMPGVPCMDALDNQRPCHDLQGQMDLWIPRTDLYENYKDFYDYRLMIGEPRWTYTCCVPNTPNYLNKFIDLPYWHNRLLFWGCFARGFTGFLHWGYNYWDPDDVYFGLSPQVMFKGDGYIVYPDPETGGIKSSVRLLCTRDSAEEYELLRIVAERDAGRAFELAGKVLTNFHDFTWDVGTMIQAREELLQAAEAAQQA